MEFLHAHPWLLAVAIFAARVTDVSMGTVRTILVFRGFRALASSIAFFEVLLWVVAVSQVLRNLDAWYLAVAYAAGFATGNYVGMWLEGRLAIGTELVRAISVNPDVHLADRLRASAYDVIEIPGKGADDRPVEILLVVEKRRRVPVLIREVREADPDAVCTLSDVRFPRAPVPQRSRRAATPGGPRAVGKRK